MSKRRRWYLLSALLLAALALARWPWRPIGAPAGTFPQSVQTEHFVVRYTTAGRDASSTAFARRVGREAEAALAAFRRQGLREPYGAPPWRITLRQLGEDDLGTAEGWPDGPTEIELGVNLAGEPAENAGGSLATVAHELFHGIQAAYVPDLDRLPDFVVEGTPDACTYAALDGGSAKDALLVDTVAAYSEEGRRRSIGRQEHAASGYWTVLADRYDSATFCRRLLEALAHADAAAALARVTGLPEEALLPTVALRLYGEYVWRADELGTSDPPDPVQRFDLWRPDRALLRELQAGHPVTLDADADGEALRARPQAVGAISLSDWGLRGRVQLRVQAAGDLSVYYLVGSGRSDRLGDWQVAAAGSGGAVVLDAAAARRILLLVLRRGGGGAVDYRLEMQPGGAPALTPLEPLPELLRRLETPRGG